MTVSTPELERPCERELNLPLSEPDYPLPDLLALDTALRDDDMRSAFALVREVCLLPQMCARLCPGLSIPLPGDHNGTQLALRDAYIRISESPQLTERVGATIPADRTGKRIAVVGGGPAGICGAVSLIERGHDVTLFEKTNSLGGVPEHLIRSSRYTGDQAEIEALLAPALSSKRLIVEFDQALGDALQLDALTNEFDAVLLSVGLWQEHSLGHIEGVVDGLSFLAKAKAGRRTDVPHHVVVLAGGDSAMDAAVVAQELGAVELTVIFSGKLENMHWHLPESWFRQSGARCMEETRVLEFCRGEDGKLGAIEVEGVYSPCLVEEIPAGLVIEAMRLNVDEDVRAACGEMSFRGDGFVRLAGHHSYATSLQRVFAAGGMTNGGASVGRCVAEGMLAAQEIDRYLSRPNAGMTGKSKPHGLTLQSCKKLSSGRTVAPEETVSQLEAMIAGQYDYRLVEEQVSDYLHWTALFIDDLDFLSMGKGTQAIMSKAGALAECAEWLSSLDTAELPGFVMSHQDTMEDHLPIEDLVTHVDGVDADVLRQIKELDNAHYWVDGYSLIHEKPIKVPVDYVRQINAPNGLAAGNRIEEAIVHATNEIFERRALITVLKNRMVVPTIDPASIENAVIQSQLSFLEGKGIEIQLKDLSFEGSLPCVGAYFFDPHMPATHQFRHFFKAGSAFNRIDAMTRVFTEYVQGRRLDEFISDDAEEQKRVLEHDFRRLRCIPDDGDNYLSTFLFGFVPFASADFLREGDVVAFRDDPGFDDCLDDIEACKALCRSLDRDYIVVDCTDPDIGFPVAQVIIPGYSDILPYHPADSQILFESWTREGAIRSYGVRECES